MSLDEIIDIALIIGVIFGVILLFSESLTLFLVGVALAGASAVGIEHRGSNFLKDK